mmetsp:Transcript_69397/g.219623  ORF Transcript_69397/g.219623 Transcript_69397/m.219623 type:complete len:245 (-) Transcript_69397:924-1658(-)
MSKRRSTAAQQSLAHARVSAPPGHPRGPAVKGMKASFALDTSATPEPLKGHLDGSARLRKRSGLKRSGSSHAPSCMCTACRHTPTLEPFFTGMPATTPSSATVRCTRVAGVWMRIASFAHASTKGMRLRASASTPPAASNAAAASSRHRCCAEGFLASSASIQAQLPAGDSAPAMMMSTRVSASSCAFTWPVAWRPARRVPFSGAARTEATCFFATSSAGASASTSASITPWAAPEPLLADGSS